MNSYAATQTYIITHAHQNGVDGSDLKKVDYGVGSHMENSRVRELIGS